MRVVILGAGGHGQVVADVLQRAGAGDSQSRVIGYVDDDPGLREHMLLGVPVLGNIAALAAIEHDAVIVAIGHNLARRELFARLQAGGERFATAKHPSAIIGSEVHLGEGCMVCAGAIVGPASRIGVDVILNTACSVDHHNQIADHVHIGPGAHLGGEVQVAEGALVGMGATVLPRCRVGAWSTVAAGAVVTEDVPDGATVVGVPARLLMRKAMSP
jgi:sugar O-acyltransferase (sialic acid O-acetyltransferase NeuD family)